MPLDTSGGMCCRVWLNGSVKEALELQTPAEEDQIVIVERKKAA
jgi:hypothetical protein